MQNDNVTAVHGRRRQPQAQGVLLTLAPLSLLMVASESTSAVLLAVGAMTLLALSAILLSVYPRVAQPGAMIACVLAAIPAVDIVSDSPQAALLAWIALTSLIFIVTRPPVDDEGRGQAAEIARLRMRWGITTGLAVVCMFAYVDPPRTFLAIAPFFASLIVIAGFILHWVWRLDPSVRTAPPVLSMATVAIVSIPLLFFAVDTDWLYPLSVTTLAFLVLIASVQQTATAHSHWWEPLISHPARVLLTTFLGLCALGTAALLLPGTTTSGSISFSEAVFTAVSATCVTGLIVLDTPNDFTVLGQTCILLLIQLGGLGIMSISTVALYSLGRRLSMRQERIIESIHGGDGASLLDSLKRVLRVTVLCETLGAAALFFLFLSSGDTAGQALWRAVFTAVSAFCNAGFALQSDSLMPYAETSPVLHVVATLIILGGMAPVMSVALLRRVRGERLDPASRIVFWMTGILLMAGTVAVLSLEWGKTLAPLSPFDRLHNAWFQSVTLRTAGFNSIDIAQVSPPTLLIMIVFMFIGGSPGGTAGGVKTTTVAILLLAAWTSISGRDQLVAVKRKVPHDVVYRAIAIVIAGAALWILVVTALLMTQAVPERDLVFEATSALGTVGLSTGATTALDGVGRTIIIVAMFLGRLGPLTLFLLLGTDREPENMTFPETRIPLT